MYRYRSSFHSPPRSPLSGFLMQTATQLRSSSAGICIVHSLTFNLINGRRLGSKIRHTSRLPLAGSSSVQFPWLASAHANPDPYSTPTWSASPVAKSGHWECTHVGPRTFTETRRPLGTEKKNADKGKDWPSRRISSEKPTYQILLQNIFAFLRYFRFLAGFHSRNPHTKLINQRSCKS